MNQIFENPCLGQSPPLRAATSRRGCWPSSRVARHGLRLQRLPAARRLRRTFESGASPPGARLSSRPPRLPSRPPLPSARPSLRLLLLPTGRSQHRRPQLLCRPGRRLRLLLRRLRSPSVQPQCCRGSPMSRRGECQALIVPPWHYQCHPFFGVARAGYRSTVAAEVEQSARSDGYRRDQCDGESWAMCVEISKLRSSS